MAGKNDTSNLFVNVLDSVGTFVKDLVDHDIGKYNTTNRFNTSCSEEMLCDNVALYCNLTTQICHCAEFHFWNDTNGICEFSRKYMNEWISKKFEINPTKPIIYLTKIEPEASFRRFEVALPVLIIMIIGCLCFLSCVIYICIGHNEVGKDKTVSSALFKQHKIQASIVNKI